MKELAYYTVTGKQTVQTKKEIGVPAGIYYIKVCPDSYSGVDYTLTLQHKSSNVWERELNETRNTARNETRNATRERNPYSEKNFEE